jgi:hypothetical protein
VAPGTFRGPLVVSELEEKREGVMSGVYNLTAQDFEAATRDLRHAADRLTHGERPTGLAEELAALMAEVFHRWARMGHYNSHILARDGGPQTVALARHILSLP